MRKMLGSLFGLNSIITIDNPQHRINRKMISPAFHAAKISSMVSIMADETAKRVDELITSLSTTTPTVIELHAFFIDLTFRIIMSSSFGNSLETIPTASSTIHHALTVTLPIMQKRQLALVEYIPIVSSLPILGKTDADAGKRAMEEMVMRMVQERRAGKSHSNCDGNDLLDILINARNPETGEGFEDIQIRSDCMVHTIHSHSPCPLHLPGG